MRWKGRASSTQKICAKSRLFLDFLQTSHIRRGSEWQRCPFCFDAQLVCRYGSDADILSIYGYVLLSGGFEIYPFNIAVMYHGTVGVSLYHQIHCSYLMNKQNSYNTCPPHHRIYHSYPTNKQNSSKTYNTCGTCGRREVHYHRCSLWNPLGIVSIFSFLRPNEPGGATIWGPRNVNYVR